ncbi:MAG: PadR family transcriptional regulator [Clostridia bacterium]|nr:PadR family transcriptional regulator [Clostridia bacterium]
MGRKPGIKNTGHSFEDYFKRATSPMMTLLLLNEKPMYVYHLSQELEKRSNNTYKMNFLYPVLYRLQQQGYVTEYTQEMTENHRTRNYYAITDEGREHLQLMLVQYRDLLGAVDTVIASCMDKPLHQEEEQ